ncbi:hypothetical protein IMY05_C4664000200 [Salix suchowensis]|nr:hypothetical protein IMY05_C4664000200 [Salix suchowensis]
MERTIGNLGAEIRHHQDPYANLTQRALLRAQCGPFMPWFPSVLAQTAWDLQDGYALLQKRDDASYLLDKDESTALCQFLRINYVGDAALAGNEELQMDSVSIGRLLYNPRCGPPLRIIRYTLGCCWNGSFQVETCEYVGRGTYHKAGLRSGNGVASFQYDEWNSMMVGTERRTERDKWAGLMMYCTSLLYPIKPGVSCSFPTTIPSLSVAYNRLFTRGVVDARCGGRIIWRGKVRGPFENRREVAVADSVGCLLSCCSMHLEADPGRRSQQKKKEDRVSYDRFNGHTDGKLGKTQSERRAATSIRARRCKTTSMLPSIATKAAASKCPLQTCTARLSTRSWSLIYRSSRISAPSGTPTLLLSTSGLSSSEGAHSTTPGSPGTVHPCPPTIAIRLREAYL